MAHLWGVRLRVVHLCLVGFLCLIGSVAAGCTLAPESFAVSELHLDVASRSVILEGDEVAITARVHNTGGGAATYVAQLMVNGADQPSHDVDLAPGEARVIRFLVQAGPPGEYDVRLGEERISFRVADPPAFTVSDLAIAGEQTVFVVGDRVALTAEVRNTGGAPGTYDAILLVNGQAHSAQAVALAPDERRTVEFAFAAATAGDYEVRLGEQHLSFPVEDAASFSVTDLQVSDSDAGVLPGERVTVTARIQNTGAVGSVYLAELTVDGAVEVSRAIELTAGEVRLVEFGFDAGRPGTYLIGLEEATTPLVVAAQAAFAVTGLSLEPEDADAGAPVTVSVTIENSGGSSGTYVVELTVDGVVSQTRQVTLAAGERTTTDFSITAGDPGRYVIAVDELASELLVRAIERPANGTVLLNKVRGGMGRLTIENGNDRDAVVVLARAADPSRPLLAVYVRAGADRTIKRIEDGSYALLFSLGERWDGATNAFSTNVVYRQTSGTLDFRTTRVSGGYRYTIWKVTLHTVQGGDTPIIDIGEGEFPSLP